MNPTAFTKELRNLKFENTFNPYSDCCALYDTRDAPGRRAEMIEAILRCATEDSVDAIWIGRDLGHRGGRRTGLALTDDIHLIHHLHRWGLELCRPTRGAPVAERTAAVIWQMLGLVQSRIFLWNVFPLHPHEPGDPFSNRAHNARERRAGEELLYELAGMLRPAHIVAIGNDAYEVARKVLPDVKAYKVRHPSYGGQSTFIAQVRELYGLSDIDQQPTLL